MADVPLLFVLHPHLDGFRWAVMRSTVDDLIAHPTRGCINAGYEASRVDADVTGQLALYSILSFAASLGGLSTPVSNVSLDYDPLPDPRAMSQADASQVSEQVLQIGV